MMLKSSSNRWLCFGAGRPFSLYRPLSPTTTLAGIINLMPPLAPRCDLVGLTAPASRFSSPKS